jgi:hypothetical protein
VFEHPAIITKAIKNRAKILLRINLFLDVSMAIENGTDLAV